MSKASVSYVKIGEGVMPNGEKYETWREVPTVPFIPTAPPWTREERVDAIRQVLARANIQLSRVGTEEAREVIVAVGEAVRLLEGLR